MLFILRYLPSPAWCDPSSTLRFLAFFSACESAVMSPMACRTSSVGANMAARRELFNTGTPASWVWTTVKARSKTETETWRARRVIQGQSIWM